MMLKRILTGGALLFAMAAGTRAQTSGAGVVVQTWPPGAEVVLKGDAGDAKVAGITPTTFSQPLVGEYSVIISRPGYERHKSKILLDPSKQFTIDVTLSPKTRVKAAARSIFFPGWGQRYSDQKTRGFMYTLLAAGSVGAFFIIDKRFDDDFAEFDSRRSAYEHAYDNGSDFGTLQTLHAEMAAAQRIAYDSENDRRVALGVVAGVWALNVLDALIFFPTDRGSYSFRPIGLESTTASGLPGLALVGRF